MRWNRCGMLALLALVSLNASDFAKADPSPDTPASESNHATVLDGSPRANRVAVPAEFPSISLSANEMSLATGNPSLVLMSSGSTSIPVWSLSGGTVGQSVVGLVKGFPAECAAVRVEIVVTTTHKDTSPQFEDVYRVHLSQMLKGDSFASKNIVGDSVRTRLPEGPFRTRTIVLNSYYPVEPDAPLSIRIQREPGDDADTFVHPTGLAMVIVTPLTAPPPASVTQAEGGYNSWPMIQSIGETLVCTYSRGSGHTTGEPTRGVYARVSTDEGKTWKPETLVANTSGFGDVTVGKGLDSTGAMLLWVRRIGKGRYHDLYRTEDGVKYELIATPQLEVSPIQITDIFHVPTVGLMSLWFAGSYAQDSTDNSWGIVTSNDDGRTWKQVVVESGLTRSDWPTEPSAVYLGDGKILALARTETRDNSTRRSQFQMISTDSGATWKRSVTNIGDVMASTPSLIYNPDTRLVTAYYYHRGHKPGLLRRRVTSPDNVFQDALNWPPSEVVTTGSHVTFDAGNANATTIGDLHFIAFYSGAGSDTSVLVSALPAPR